MYTLSGTFGEVVAFIRGYIGGVSKDHPDAPIVLEWFDFSEWLRAELDLNHGDVFQTFGERYGNDESGLRKLHEYFDAYRSGLPHSTKGLSKTKLLQVKYTMCLTPAGGNLMELTDSFKALLIDTANTLKGSARRLFMARTVKELGAGGQRRAERELGWSRGTIRKGTHELESGVTCVDNFAARGRKRAEDHLPNLLTDITSIVDRQSQTDPQFRTNRLYTRLSAAEVRRQLIAHSGYTDDELPTAETIGAKLNVLGYYPQKVAKTQPQKKSQKPTPSSSR
jgi:hypothetical protein